MCPDIIVVGAGIIGGSIAWKLAQSGLQVELVDAGKAGGEASWAGAGMLAPGGEIEEHSEWSDFALESLRRYPAFVEELQAESGLGIDYQRLGAVEAAVDETEWQSLRARAEVQRGLGIPWEPLSAAELRKRVPLLERETAGALFFPEDALVDPRDVMQALRAVWRSRGVRLREDTRVTAMHLAHGEARLETLAGTLTAGGVVLAAGAWSSQVAVQREGRQRELPESLPVRGHLLGYRLEAGSLGPILRRRHTYLLQRANGFTIAGTSVERVGFRREVDPNAVAEIAERAGELIPRLRTAGAPEAWLGFRPGTADLEPRIGRFEDSNLWLAYGHYRNGILLAPATAERVRRAITSSSETDSPGIAGSAG